HVASKRIASKASLLGLAFVAAALAPAQSTPNQSQPDALELLRNVEATYAAVGTYSTKSTHVIEMNGPSMQNKMGNYGDDHRRLFRKIPKGKHGPNGHGDGLRRQYDVDLHAPDEQIFQDFA